MTMLEWFLIALIVVQCLYGFAVAITIAAVSFVALLIIILT